jgi:hypothetical protein
MSGINGAQAMQVRIFRVVFALLVGGIIGVPSGVHAAEPAEAVKPAISDEANTALQQMSKTLLNKDLSFKAQTIRVYQDAHGQPLHIFHTMKVVARRPDRLAVTVTGDDGSAKLLYDGKTVSVLSVDKNKYASLAAPAQGGIPAALEELMDKVGHDFPLVDLFSDAPDKAFLSGVTTGWQVDTAMIDGTECRHLFFSQRGGIDLELWVDKTQQALPRRLIVTYRLMPGQPDFVASFSDWDFKTQPADSEFVFQPPAGATKIDLSQAAGVPGQGGII